jgi:hypothetical protein
MQGCAYLGVGIMKSERESCSEVKIGERPAAGGGYDVPTNAVVYDTKWLQTHWGNPASVRKEPGGAYEVWKYKFGPIWKGAVPIIFVPIPLVVPLEREKVEFVLRDGCVVHMTVVNKARTGSGFAFTLMGPCGPGAGTFDFDD